MHTVIHTQYTGHRRCHQYNNSTLALFHAHYEGVHILYHTSVNYVALIPAGHELAASSGELDLQRTAAQQEFVTFGSVYPLEMQGMDEPSKRLQQNARYGVANV